MSTMLEALANAGLVPEKALHEAAAQVQLDQEETTRRAQWETKERERRMKILRSTDSTAKFRYEAHMLLLLAPNLIVELVQLAHDRGMKKKPKGTRLIANLLELRNAMNGLGEEEQVRCVKQILQKN